MTKFKSKYLKPFKNIYVIILVAFVVWMLFLDSNSFLIHQELNKEKEKNIEQKEFYIEETEKNNKAIKELSKPEGIEKLAREEYYMKRENEDIFIIEYEDSLKTKNNER
jgi:cell division protein FtsB